MLHTILTKTAKTGQVITVAVDGADIRARMDNKDLGISIGGVWALQTPQGDVTHYLATTPKIGLTAAEAEIINAAFADRREREALVSSIQDAMGNWSDCRNRDDGGTGLRFAEAAKFEAEADAARAELRAFDLAHPDLKAEIDEERAVENARKVRAAENA